MKAVTENFYSTVNYTDTVYISIKTAVKVGVKSSNSRVNVFIAFYTWIFF